MYQDEISCRTKIQNFFVSHFEPIIHVHTCICVDKQELQEEDSPGESGRQPAGWRGPRTAQNRRRLRQAQGTDTTILHDTCNVNDIMQSWKEHQLRFILIYGDI